VSRLRARDVLLSDNALDALRSLEDSADPDARSVVRRIAAMRNLLLSDCLHGEVVPKARIPASLGKRHRLENLYVEDLPSFWRLLYTVNRERGNLYVFIVEIVDHRAYSKWFRRNR